MILDELQLTLDRNRQKNPLYLRNLLKEHLQYYLLNFVYNSPYAEKFLFKGGTCLRFCFDLPRLSEDLDFDVKDFKGLRAEYAGKDMIFDAKSMLFIDAEGLRCLLDACKLMKNRGSYFDICNVQGNPQKVDCGRNPARIFHITGVRHLFTGYQNNLDQALEAYKAYIQQSAKVE